MKLTNKWKKVTALLMTVILLGTFSVQNAVAFGSTQKSQLKNETAGEIESIEICGPAGIGALSGAVVAGVALVGGAYQAGKAIGEFMAGVLLPYQMQAMENLELEGYSRSDFSEFDV